MKKTKRHKLPTPPTPCRGILAEIARDLGISRQAVRKRYRAGHAETVLEVVRREKRLKNEKLRAAQELVRVLRGVS